MPKVQPCLNEHSPRATCSKHAKDKSNSTTLLAIRNSKNTDDSSGRGSRCSSEKDSGYSDGSDWQQTDVEDQQSNKSQYRCSERAETSQPGKNRDLGQRSPGNPTLMAAGRELPPIYIVKNTVLKQRHQPDMIPKRGQLSWRNGVRKTGSYSAAHMILTQQPDVSPAAIQLRKALSRKSSATGTKIKGTYRPILNSYPRIAPHPSKKPPGRSSLNNDSQNLSKRVCTEQRVSKSEGTPGTRSLPEQQPRVAVSTSGLPCSSSIRASLSSSSPTAVTSSQGSPPGSSLYSASSSPAARGLHSTRHCRYLNTVEILRQSSLLNITLRTKELLRQSNATGRDVAQLRQHTELLCQAASEPSCSLKRTAAWEHLHRAMAESGSYPDLKLLQNVPVPCHPDSAGQPEGISTSAENSEVAPHPNQNCLVPQQSHPGKGRELEASYKSLEKVTFMPPDSSTG